MVTSTEWIAACALAELLGMGAAASAFGLASSLGADAPDALVMSRLGGYLLTVAAGAVEGAALGVFQGRVLRRVIPRLPHGRFIGLMVTIGVVGWAIGMLPSVLAPQIPEPATEPSMTTLLAAAVLFGGGGGLVIGLLQAWVLQPLASPLWPWILANIFGWATAFIVIFAGAAVMPGDTSLITLLLAGAVTGLAAGAALGIITLPALRKLTPSADKA